MLEPMRPRLAFHVGVVGHRRLPRGQLEAVCARAEELFRSLHSELIAFMSEDGAAAQIYDPGQPTLRCFSGFAVGADHGLAEASVRQGFSVIAALPFKREEFERDFQEGPELEAFRAALATASEVIELDGDRARETDAYVKAGEFLIEHSDLLIAVWDGQRARGAGGTAEVVACAFRAGRPIFVIPPADPESAGFFEAETIALRDVVRSRLRVAVEGDFPAAYFAETREAAPWSAELVRIYDRVLARGLANPVKMSSVPLPIEECPLQHEFKRADRRAVAYGSLYRAAGLLRYGLVIPATAGAIVASLNYRPFEIAGNVADFVILIFIVTFSAKRWQAPVHERFVNYRGLAETLRGAMFLAPFAAAIEANARDWTSWLATAYAKAEGPRSVRFDQSTLEKATGEVRARTLEQIDYMTARANRYRVAAARLSRIGMGLSSLGIIFAGLRAVFLVASFGASSLLWLNGAALVLPALGPVFLGLASFNEYSRHAARYEAVAEELTHDLADLERAKLSRTARIRIVRQITDKLIAESAVWRTLTKLRSVSAF